MPDYQKSHSVIPKKGTMKRKMLITGFNTHTSTSSRGGQKNRFYYLDLVLCGAI